MCVYMEESEKREKRVCFTGHRPKKIITPENTIKDKLKEEIIKAIRKDTAYSFPAWHDAYTYGQQKLYYNYVQTDMQSNSYVHYHTKALKKLE